MSNMLMSNNKKVLKIVNKIKSKEILDCTTIPEEYRENIDVVLAERVMGLREVTSKGYDVVRKCFFVNELLKMVYRRKTEKKQVTNTFECFEEYYDYLAGDIYENACYYQYEFTPRIINKYRIDIKRINKKSLIGETIDECIPFETVKANNGEREKREKRIKQWTKKFNKCVSAVELRQESERHRRSLDDVDELFYISNYIRQKGEIAFENIMGLVNSGIYPAFRIEEALPFIYDSERIIELYNYSAGSKTTRLRHNRTFKEHINRIKKEGVNTEVDKFFDNRTQYYCIKTYYYYKSDKNKQKQCASWCWYFEKFQDFAKELDYDLSDCDLSNAPEIIINDEFKTNGRTKMPVNDDVILNRCIKKEYNKYNDCYYVEIEWKNESDQVVYEIEKRFDYFFDFVAFLKGDLSGSNMLFCEGLKNLNSTSELIFDDSDITSEICEKIGMKYRHISLKKEKVGSFDETREYENYTEPILQLTRQLNELDSMETYGRETKTKIYYVSDLHLMHKLADFRVKSESDVRFVLKKIIKNIIDEVGNVLLIAGDVSSDFEIYEMFIKLLREEIDSSDCNPYIIVTLGNHELWDFSGHSMKRIIRKYDSLLSRYGMNLLHNNIIYKDCDNTWNSISTDEINNLSSSYIRSKLKTSRIVFFGGLAFSGCNEMFNADSGIYRGAITRSEEIKESKCFRKLYEKVLAAVSDRKIVVVTHTPMECWSKATEYQKGYVYVSGHTHRNEFHDDGEIRIYSDNQIGYENNNPHLKWFYIDSEYDYFDEYEDGIFQISKDDYLQFCRGKNIMLEFTREVNVLYMIKKKGYYCFIHKAKNNSLTILNGGQRKRLERQNIHYYYNNIDSQIALIKNPLEKYTAIQKELSDVIRKIGGSGRIHGCIVDVDWNSHLYVNPIDLKVTSYWATDIVNKKVYPNTLELLRVECPTLYDNYKKMLNHDSKGKMELLNNKVSKTDELSQVYLSTDIYKVSREISKMQKLNSNVLVFWHENRVNRKEIE